MLEKENNIDKETIIKHTIHNYSSDEKWEIKELNYNMFNGRVECLYLVSEPLGLGIKINRQSVDFVLLPNNSCSKQVLNNLYLEINSDITMMVYQLFMKITTNVFSKDWGY